MEALRDDGLALVINQFSWFHNNRMNHRHGSQEEGCFGCGGPDHFGAKCPKKSKHSSGTHDVNKRKNKREYTSSKHKNKGMLDKEVIKKKYLKKAKAQEGAFLASLSDLDIDSGDDHASSSSSNEDPERKVEEKLDRLCFFVDSTHGGFCTMALGDEVESGKDGAPGNDDAS